MQSPILIMAPLHEPTLTALEASYVCHRLWSAADKPALFQQLADSCKVVVTNGGRGISGAEMALLPKLELVDCFGVGVDAIDLDYARSHRIVVTNTPDVLTDDVADLALSLLLATIRRIPFGDQFVRQGKWLKGGMPLTRTMQRRKIGVVGLGRIGQAIAQRCAAFNTSIGYYGPRRKADVSYQYFDDVVALADWADVLIAACPGGAATNKIVSRAALKALGSDGIFVNIARGSVVDQDALVELLVSGELGGAGLDVFNNEPNAPSALFALENVVLQPHQGSATHATRAQMGRLVLENAAAYAAGKPLVTPV
jgi:lactate dehydrogenase-like 2-hydroxyacid dehydrogenase